MAEPWIYKPYEERTPDWQYHDLLQTIIDEGRDGQSFHDDTKRAYRGATLRFDPANGFPLLTERDLSGSRFSGAVGEILAFAHGARTQKELEQWGVSWWKPWTTKEKCEVFGLEEGDIGPGSYGAVFGNFPHPNGDTFNQFERILQQMKDFPHATTHFIDSWYPPFATGTKDDPRKVTVAPCHGQIQLEIDPDNTLTIIHTQRSMDVPVGGQFNLIQYGTIAMIFAQVLGLTVREYVFQIRNAHIYLSQMEYVEELLSRDPRSFPTVELDPSVTDFFDVRPRHFYIKDYNPHPWFPIPTPV